jgi:hypothetical protein
MISGDMRQTRRPKKQSLASSVNRDRAGLNPVHQSHIGSTFYRPDPADDWSRISRGKLMMHCTAIRASGEVCAKMPPVPRKFELAYPPPSLGWHAFTPGAPGTPGRRVGMSITDVSKGRRATRTCPGTRYSGSAAGCAFSGAQVTRGRVKACHPRKFELAYPPPSLVRSVMGKLYGDEVRPVRMPIPRKVGGSHE